MSINRYYEKELIALRVMGKEFADNNPALAPFFNTPGKDPDVERILEGVAFLTGRLREKLDDELPEITYSLFNLLWPNYLRPLPACSVIQFLPPKSLSKKRPCSQRLSGAIRSCGWHAMHVPHCLRYGNPASCACGSLLCHQRRRKRHGSALQQRERNA